MLIKYKCILCDNYIEKLILKKEQVKGVLACQCGGFLERELNAPSSNAVESIDDGATVTPIYYDKERVQLARQQGDDLIQEQKKKDQEDVE